jgi:hypothetical protein
MLPAAGGVALSANMPRMFPRTPMAMLFAALIVSSAAHAATTTAATPTKSATAKWNPVVPFIEDDFGRALALAKERKLPVFIEGWAPW